MEVLAEHWKLSWECHVALCLCLYFFHGWHMTSHCYMLLYFLFN